MCYGMCQNEDSSGQCRGGECPKAEQEQSQPMQKCGLECKECEIYEECTEDYKVHKEARYCTIYSNQKKCNWFMNDEKSCLTCSYVEKV